MIVNNMFDGAKPITPDVLHKLYNSVFKEKNLMSQRIISYCLLAFAECLRVSELLYIERSDIIFESYYVSIFISKSKTDIYHDEIQLSYPEWIATCIQLKQIEKYLLLLNRNLTNCKDRSELRMENRPLSYTCKIR